MWGQALAGKAGVAGGQERGKVELVGCWLLATHSPDASFPPPHSGTSEFDGFPTPTLTDYSTAGPSRHSLPNLSFPHRDISGHQYLASISLDRNQPAM